MQDVLRAAIERSGNDSLCSFLKHALGDLRLGAVSYVKIESTQLLVGEVALRIGEPPSPLEWQSLVRSLQAAARSEENTAKYAAMALASVEETAEWEFGRYQTAMMARLAVGAAMVVAEYFKHVTVPVDNEEQHERQEREQQERSRLELATLQVALLLVQAAVQSATSSRAAPVFAAKQFQHLMRWLEE
ncbi:MAG TPA: hypothetical protein V6C86_25510 [Oculatellaceae cyanobacterium]